MSGQWMKKIYIPKLFLDAETTPGNVVKPQVGQNSNKSKTPIKKDIWSITQSNKSKANYKHG